MSTYFTLPFDPSGYTAISGAQLAQLVGGLGPAAGYGLCISTTDDAFGVPTVPDPTSIPALLSFLWLRFGNTSNASATLYIWNPNAATAVTLKKWQIANISSITTGSITGTQIAANTVTDNNIFSVGWNKLPSGGAVGGVLIGSMPNPGLANNVVASANIVNNSIGVNQLAFGTAYQTYMTNAAGNAIQLITDYFAALSSVTPLGTAGQIARVNSGATGLEWVNNNATGRILQIYSEQNNSSQTTTTVLAPGTAMTTGNAALLTHFGSAGSISFTPISASSKILIDVNVQTTATGGDACQIGLFNGSSLLCSSAALTGGSVPVGVVLSYTLASVGTSMLTFKLYFAAASTNAEVNQYTTCISTVKITEYL